MRAVGRSTSSRLFRRLPRQRLDGCDRRLRALSQPHVLDDLREPLERRERAWVAALSKRPEQREIRAQIRVAQQSGEESGHLAVTSSDVAEGADAILEKPIDRVHLLAKVSSLIERKDEENLTSGA